MVERIGNLGVVSVPSGAAIEVDGKSVGISPVSIPVSLDKGEYSRKVELKISGGILFKDKLTRKTIRPGLTYHYLYSSSPKVSIKGKTSKDNKEKTITFTFSILDRKSKIPIPWSGNLDLRNQTNMKKKVVPSSGEITIPYSDDFFASGKQKLCCVVPGSGDKIRTFKTLTTGLGAAQLAVIKYGCKNWVVKRIPSGDNDELGNMVLEWCYTRKIKKVCGYETEIHDWVIANQGRAVNCTDFVLDSTDQGDLEDEWHDEDDDDDGDTRSIHSDAIDRAYSKIGRL